MACDMAARSSFREKSLYNNCALHFWQEDFPLCPCRARYQNHPVDQRRIA